MIERAPDRVVSFSPRARAFLYRARRRETIRIGRTRSEIRRARGRAARELFEVSTLVQLDGDFFNLNLFDVVEAALGTPEPSAEGSTVEVLGGSRVGSNPTGSPGRVHWFDKRNAFRENVDITFNAPTNTIVMGTGALGWDVYGFEVGDVIHVLPPSNNAGFYEVLAITGSPPRTMLVSGPLVGESFPGTDPVGIRSVIDFAIRTSDPGQTWPDPHPLLLINRGLISGFGGGIPEPDPRATSPTTDIVGGRGNELTQKFPAAARSGGCGGGGAGFTESTGGGGVGGTCEQSFIGGTGAADPRFDLGNPGANGSTSSGGAGGSAVEGTAIGNLSPESVQDSGNYGGDAIGLRRDLSVENLGTIQGGGGQGAGGTANSVSAQDGGDGGSPGADGEDDPLVVAVGGLAGRAVVALSGSLAWVAMGTVHGDVV